MFPKCGDLFKMLQRFAVFLFRIGLNVKKESFSLRAKVTHFAIFSRLIVYKYTDKPVAIKSVYSIPIVLAAIKCMHNFSLAIKQS